jgi:hypothetical protein
MTASIPPNPATVRLHDPGELIAAVPHLIGFRPRDSLVLVTREGSGSPLGPTVRADLPVAGEGEALCEHLAEVLARHHTSTALAVVVGGAEAPLSSSPPRRSLLGPLAAAFAARGVELGHAYWAAEVAAGARWCCYEADRCAGELPEPESSPLAAAGVLDGEVTFASRAEVESLLDPDPAKALRRRRALLDRQRARRAAPTSARARLERLLGHIEACAACAAVAAQDDNTIVALLRALADHRVRDAVLCPEPHAAGAERLWLALARAAPAPERAEPACLLGLCAYLRGAGALANIALHAAQRADPDHSLTQLLLTATAHAIAPKELGELVRTASLQARAELLGSDPAGATGPTTARPA